MTTTITIIVFPEERIDLIRLRCRLLKEVRDRVRAAPPPNGPGLCFTDTAREAERLLPIIERILNYPTIESALKPFEPVGGFKVGDEVFWTSQAGGSSKAKAGKVVAVVPSHELPICPAGMRLKGVHYISRNHESYLVQVGRNRTLYWPLTKYLKRATV